jgi:hypothetical protein
MKNMMVAFKPLGHGIGYKWIKCDIIFDVRMEFERKAHFVVEGHLTHPSTLAFSSVVCRDST